MRSAVAPRFLNVAKPGSARLSKRWSRAVAASVAVASSLALPAASPAPVAAKTLWLCNPVTLRSDPCRPPTSTLVLDPSGQRQRIEHPQRPRHPQFDCFYIYPTVSDFPGPQAPLRIFPEQRSIAEYQVARFSLACRVFAPVYRQLTLRGITVDAGKVTPEMREQAYGDVRAAFLDYLRRYNRGRRGVVLIGHSQGTFTLRRLLRAEVDGRPTRRRLLVSALLIGGNVLVRQGSDRGGDFRHLRVCTSPRQTGCVIAYSTYGERPPADAVFGNPRVSFGLPLPPGPVEVACTNPANLQPGGKGLLTPIYPSQAFARGTTIGALTEQLGTPRVERPGAFWLKAPRSYTAGCVRANGAHVLLVSPRRGAPPLKPVPNASWGLHLADVNIALGNLVELVERQAATWRAQRRR